MPLNSEGKDVAYTSSEEVGFLMENPNKDFSVEFIGYIQSVQGRCAVVINGNETELFKCIITNGQEKITLLIWDIKRIDELSGEFTADRIVHLDGCEGQVVTKKTYHKFNDLLNYEIIIQPESSVEFEGYHVRHPKLMQPTIPTIEFLDVAKVVGKIKLKAYIKTVVTAAHNRDGPLGFGSGAVTEGIHKLPLRVSTFKYENSSKLVKGVCVMILGTVSQSDPLTLFCQDMSSIVILDEEKPLDKAIVSKANKPLKRCMTNNYNDGKNKRLALKETNI